MFKKSKELVGRTKGGRNRGRQSQEVEELEEEILHGLECP